MLDIERFQRERSRYEEAWKTPVTIRFGAVFEMLTGGLQEPLYSLGVVSNIGTGIMFKGFALIRGQVDETTGAVLPDLIGGGGDLLRSNILRMTDEVLSPEQVLEGYKRSFLSLPEPDYWEGFRVHLEELSRKGSRVLPGI